MSSLPIRPFRLFLLICVVCFSWLASTAASWPKVAANDNRVAAGKLENGVLTLRLEAREAEWFPESDQGRSLRVFTFAEEGQTPQIPGPLIRVPAGTEIRCTVRNRLDHALTVHGLHARPGDAAEALRLEPGQVRDVRFRADAPGTYYYWADAGGDIFNNRPYRDDSQLNGAFVVDPPGAKAADRIFALSLWRDQRAPTLSLDVAAINGKSWPYNERLTYAAGEPVRWRVLNLSGANHPMHMHGGYYRVLGLGDGDRDTTLPENEQKLVATQLLPPGTTMDVLWTPDRVGRWLFHCHILAHIMSDGMFLHQQPAAMHGDHHEMVGLILGITVLPRPGASAVSPARQKPRPLQLIVGQREDGKGLGYALLEHHQTIARFTSPGPPIVLTRGEPVEIRVVNRLNEATSVHWHGIELDSYYDGVPGWTGVGRQVTPPIRPGHSFVARFTPPRAGTFIYHTHLNDMMQLSGGLYGAILVLRPGESYNPDTDHVAIISTEGIGEQQQLLLDGSKDPAAVSWAAGPQRLRMINISANLVTAVTLTRSDGELRWRAVAKDGADLPPSELAARPFAFSIAPGETYDFELPASPGTMLLKLAVPLLKEEVDQRIEVLPARAAN